MSAAVTNTSRLRSVIASAMRRHVDNFQSSAPVKLKLNKHCSAKGSCSRSIPETSSVAASWASSEAESSSRITCGNRVLEFASEISTGTSTATTTKRARGGGPGKPRIALYTSFLTSLLEK
eukprot:GHVU01123953.1.p3 GENE.GHVU01123953.1~~GHVU01123953.1.p3  ORF type:complete len:121 (-),score=11.24 GHVU01123953.1:137-499(-)